MSSQIGFVIYPCYRVKDGKAFIHIYGRLESGEAFLTINEFKPYLYIKKSDMNKALELHKFSINEENLKNFSEEIVVKILFNTQSDLKNGRDKLSKAGINCYEADLKPEYRFMIDNFIQGSLKIEGESIKENNRLVFKNPKLSSHYYFPKNLKVLSLDIETDMKGKQLYCISIVCEDFKKVLIVSSKKLNDAEHFKDEKSLLLRFKEIIFDLDPDIITGWNVIGFDFKIIEAKFKQHQIPFNIGRADENCILRISDSFFSESRADFPGRMVLDGIQVLKNNFITLEDYKLDTAAEHFLKDTKLISQENKGQQIDDAYANNQQLLVDYNLKDSELVIAILDKSTALNLTIQRSLLTGMTLDRVKASVASLDNVYLKETKKRGYVAPSSGFEEDDGEGKGGYVMDSKPGIYDYILVCDFKSLYPSIMRTFNIDPLSFIPEEKRSEYDEKDIVKLPNGACFKNTEGIMPEIIAKLLAQRDTARKEKDEYAKYAIKILMNSFYGVLANQTCRFYSREMGNGITLTGQHIIKLASEKVREAGYEVIYGDTDSIFIKSGTEDKNKAFEIGETVVASINEFLKKYTKENFNRTSHMELQFEKVYKRFIMPKGRGSDVGTKKRYAGLLIDKDGVEKLQFVGLEFVRRDWTDLAKNFQKEILDRIFHKKEVTEYIKETVQAVLAGKHDDWLVYRKAIRKDLEEYTKTTPPHVKAARMLGDNITSNVIEYYQTTEGPEPVSMLKHKIDYAHYVEKQMRPIADSVLEFFDTNFDDVVNNSKQKTLFGF